MPNDSCKKQNFCNSCLRCFSEQETEKSSWSTSSQSQHSMVEIVKAFLSLHFIKAQKFSDDNT